MSGGKVVAWVCFQPPGSADPEIYFQPDCPYPEPTADTGIWQPLVLQSDLDAAIAERDKLRSLCACAYQMAGYHDAPVKWLDAFGDAASGTPLSEWRLQANDLGDALLPYSPDTESPEAAIARAEAAEAYRDLTFDGYAVHEAMTDEAKQRTNAQAVIDVLDALNRAAKAAIAAQQARGVDRG